MIIIIGVDVFSQDLYNAPLEQRKQLAFTPKAFIGPSVGRNSVTGNIGVLAEVHVYKNVSLLGAVGYDNWGGCFSGQLRYYRQYPLRFYYGVGFSSYTGVKSYKSKMTVEGEEEKIEVEMNLHKLNCLKFAIGHHFRLGKRMRLNFELGYAVPLTTDFYEIKTPGIVLTKESENTMDLMKPSGLIIGAAFTIGLK